MAVVNGAPVRHRPK